MTEIELDGIDVSYDGVTAVTGVDLRVRDGELLVLVGPSGCGKTTLLRTIAGLEHPDAGEVVIDGRRVTDLPARKRDVSLVFQDFALFPHLTVRENLSFDLRMQGYDDADDRVQDVSEILEIGGLVDRSIDELSGGQKQRVALGRAIVTEPAAFLLDEPLANLDASLRERMRTEIARLQDDLGVTTVHVTHDQAEALTMGDRVAVVRDGRIAQVGTPEEVYRSPASVFVAGFVGSPAMNLLRGRYDSDVDAVEIGSDEDAADPQAATAGVEPAGEETNDSQTVPVGVGGIEDDSAVVLGIRPEHVEVEPERRRDDGWFDATVAFDEFRGADRYVYLEAAGCPEITARVPGRSSVSVGETLAVRFPPERLHPFDADTGQRIATGEQAESEAAAPEGDR